MVCNSDSRIVDTVTEGVQPQQHEKKKFTKIIIKN